MMSPTAATVNGAMIFIAVSVFISRPIAEVEPCWPIAMQVERDSPANAAAFIAPQPRPRRPAALRTLNIRISLLHVQTVMLSCPRAGRANLQSSNPRSLHYFLALPFHKQALH